MAIASKFPANAVSLRTVDGTLTYDLALRDTHTVDIDPKFHTLDDVAQGSRLLALLTKLGSPTVAKAPIFFMLRKKQLPRYVDVDTGGYTAADTTIPIASADVNKFKKGYHILNTITREIMRVSGTPAASMPVERSVGEVAAAAGTAGDELVILYYRGAAGDVKFLDFIRVGDVIYNYIGELQVCYGVDQYELDSGHMPGHDPLAVLRLDKLEETRLNLEFGLFFDQRSKTIRSDDGRIVYTSGGVDAFLTENETDFSGSITEAEIVAALRTLKRYGPTDRWGFASPLFMQKLNLALGQVNDRFAGTTVPTLAGIDIETYRYAGIRAHFVEQPLFDDATSTNANSLKGHCYLVDPDDMELKTMRGRLMGFFKWNMNVQTPGNRERQDQLIVNWGLAMRRPEHGARWFNVGT